MSIEEALLDKVCSYSSGKTFTEGGRGKKQCQNCKVFVGVRTSNCPDCGTEFVAGANSAKANKTSKVKPPSKNDEYEQDIDLSFCAKLGITKGRPVFAPTGACPVKLTGTDELTVMDWVEETLYAGGKKVFMPEAMKSFAREFYGVMTDEYSQVCKYIDMYYAEASEAVPETSE